MMLIVPGRIGTSSPELGVPTSFADIIEFEAVCEVEEKEPSNAENMMQSRILNGDIFAIKKS